MLNLKSLLSKEDSDFEMNDEDDNQEREKRKRIRPKHKSTNFTRFGKINLNKYFSYEVLELI